MKDAVIVLGLNIRKSKDGYRPTTYNDHDEFGMLAGEMNVLAAKSLYETGVTGTFVFATGTSKKTITAFGPDVPTEAEVYSRDFLEQIKDQASAPNIILEDKSYNTYSNLTECIQIIRQHPEWQNVAILSARYHIPRIKALWQLATQQYPINCNIEFISAEDDVLLKEQPGRYDQLIKDAYASEWGKKRLQIEAQGVQDMQDGKYVVTEFQLHKQAV